MHGFPEWVPWLIAAGVFTAAELATGTFVLVMLGGGAAAGAVVAALHGPVLVQFVVAVVVTVALLVGVRPPVRRRLLAGTDSVTGPEALVGRTAVVLRRVDAHDGRIRLNGAEWSARSFDDRRTAVIEPGTEVRVVRIDGAAAIVLDEARYLDETRHPDEAGHLEQSDPKSGDPS